MSIFCIQILLLYRCTPFRLNFICVCLLKCRDESYIEPSALLHTNVPETKAEQNVPETSSPAVVSSFIHVQQHSVCLLWKMSRVQFEDSQPVFDTSDRTVNIQWVATRFSVYNLVGYYERDSQITLAIKCVNSLYVILPMQSPNSCCVQNYRLYFGVKYFISFCFISHSIDQWHTLNKHVFPSLSKHQHPSLHSFLCVCGKCVPTNKYIH